MNQFDKNTEIRTTFGNTVMWNDILQGAESYYRVYGKNVIDKCSFYRNVFISTLIGSIYYNRVTGDNGYIGMQEIPSLIRYAGL